MKKYFLCLLAFLICGVSLFGDTRYELSWPVDGVVAPLSLGLFGASLFIEGDSGSQTAKGDINGLDRAWMASYNSTLDDLGTFGAYGLLILPGLSVLDRLDEKDTLITYAVMYGEAFFLTTGVKDLTKAAIGRWRPYTYESSFTTKGDDDYFNSFPSGHTMYVFMSATFLTTTMLTDRRDSPWTLPCIIGSYTLAGTIAGMRVASGEHFISDVVVGAALGSLIGWGVPTLHLNRGDEEITLIPAPQGIALRINY